MSYFLKYAAAGFAVMTTVSLGRDALAEQGQGVADASFTREAKEIVRAGIAEYRAGHLEAARAQFQKAWALKPSLELAATLAEVEMKLERYSDAAEHWEYYIQNLPPDRADAEIQLAECRKHLGSVRVAVDTPGAVVSLDGAVLGPAPLRVDVWVNPGTHIFDAKLAGRAPAVQRIAIGAGEAQVVSLALAGQAANAGTPARAPEAQATPGDNGGNGSATRTYVAIGGGVLSLAAIGVGVAFTVKSNSASDDAAKMRAQIATANPGGASSYCFAASGNPPPICSSYADKLDQQSSAKSIAIGGFVAGGVLAVGTLVMYVVWPSGTKSAAAPRFEVGKAGADGVIVTLRARF